MEHDSNLDILRSIAVVAVFVTHSLQVIAGCNLGEHMAYGVETYLLGRVGVLLFFVHTSLVLMKSLERTATKLSGWSLASHFYIRRLFRIYPLSILLILFSVAFSIPPNALNVPYEWRGARWLLDNILLVQNIDGAVDVSSPLWSLPYEVQMYLVLPVIYLFLRASRDTARLAVIYVSGAVLSLLHPLFHYVPCFLGGVIAYRLETIRPRFPAWLWCPTVIGVVVLYILAPQGGASGASQVLVCIAAGALIPMFRRSNGRVATAASHVAKYSYGIYLCHTPILWLLYRKLAMSGWQRAMWLPIATGGAAVACYYAVERPLIQIGAQVTSRVFAGSTASSARRLAARSSG